VRGKRYLAVTVLAWLNIIVLGWYFVYDISRMERAEAQHKEELAAIGAVLYAQNCVVCHGPLGEGVVGPPLNVESFRGDPTENTEVYDLIHRTIVHGRPGTTDPLWVRLDNGMWASYTAMPAWGVEAGGSMNEQQTAALAYFIMMGDWNRVGRYIPAPTPWIDSETGEVLWHLMPDAQGIPPEASQRGKEIFVNKACISCHTLGQVGGFVGPDLTKVGAWGLDEEFLKEWIKDPPSVVERAPRYWSNYGGPYQFPVRAVHGRDAAIDETVPDRIGEMVEGAAGQEIDQPQVAGGAVGPEFPIPNTQSLPPTTMPALGLTDEEIEDLVYYLLNLK